MTAKWSKEEINKWISYHSEITQAMVAERTALESKLIPVTAYIIISAVECYRRYPEMMEKIEAAMSAEEIGRAGRVPGNQIDAVHLWSLANFFLTGRQALITMQKITPDHEPERIAVLFDFWKRAAEVFRGDGHAQAWDAGMVLRPYPQHLVDRMAAEAEPVEPEALERIKKFSSTLMTYLFLLYFDTRVGTGDTGPYELSDGNVLLLRDFTNAGKSFFPWSDKVASNMPYSNMSAAFVLEAVKLKVNDWGTSITDPEFYLDRVVRFALFNTDAGKLERIPLGELEQITQEAKKARSDMYRLVAGMSRKEKIDSGAFVYFTFLRPFAEAAGLAESLDWTVPQASLDVYEILSMFEGSGASSSSGGLSYYTQIT
ncbi:MAG: hypothetical protein ACRD1T_07365 [Acidimicrobiia bacterium]